MKYLLLIFVVLVLGCSTPPKTLLECDYNGTERFYGLVDSFKLYQDGDLKYTKVYGSILWGNDTIRQQTYIEGWGDNISIGDSAWWKDLDLGYIYMNEYLCIGKYKHKVIIP